MSWTNELPKTLWKKIFNEVETYYDYKVERFVFFSIIF